MEKPVSTNWKFNRHKHKKHKNNKKNHGKN